MVLSWELRVNADSLIIETRFLKLTCRNYNFKSAMFLITFIDSTFIWHWECQVWDRLQWARCVNFSKCALIIGSNLKTVQNIKDYLNGKRLCACVSACMNIFCKSVDYKDMYHTYSMFFFFIGIRSGIFTHNLFTFYRYCQWNRYLLGRNFLVKHFFIPSSSMKITSNGLWQTI